jgi:preprotein translocase subunit YajC
MHQFATLSVFASSDDGGSSGAGIIQFGILLLIPVAMYFLLIRPQRKRMRAQQEIQSSLGVGDEVITTAGIYGFITGEEPDLFWLEIDDDVQIRVARAAIQGKVAATGGDSTAGKPDAKSDKADKPDAGSPAD